MRANFEAETSKQSCGSWRARSSSWRKARWCYCSCDLTEVMAAELPTLTWFQTNLASCERVIGNVNVDCMRNYFGKHTPDAPPRRRVAAAELKGRKVVLPVCSSRCACQQLVIIQWYRKATLQRHFKLETWLQGYLMVIFCPLDPAFSDQGQTWFFFFVKRWWRKKDIWHSWLHLFLPRRKCGWKGFPEFCNTAAMAVNWNSGWGIRKDCKNRNNSHQTSGSGKGKRPATSICPSFGVPETAAGVNHSTFLLDPHWQVMYPLPLWERLN